MTGVDWEHLLGTLNVDDPSVGQVAEGYADATDTSISQAYERVETALDAGGLVERDQGGTFPTVAVPETPNTGEDDPEDHDSRHEYPRLEAIEPAPTGTDRGADNVPRHLECLADAFEFFHRHPI